MKKRILSIVAIVAIAVIAGVNYTQKSNEDLSDLLLSNTDALANSETNSCLNAAHCTQRTGYKCYYHTINSDNNMFVTHHDDQIHQGQDKN